MDISCANISHLLCDNPPPAHHPSAIPLNSSTCPRIARSVGSRSMLDAAILPFSQGNETRQRNRLGLPQQCIPLRASPMQLYSRPLL